MPVRPSDALLRCPLVEEMTTGRPANAPGMSSARSRTVMSGRAADTLGMAIPAAAAALAPRKSRRLIDIGTPGRRASMVTRRVAPGERPPCVAFPPMPAEIRDRLRQAKVLEGIP